MKALDRDVTLFLTTTLFSLLQDQALTNWQVKRQVGSRTPIVYKFPHKFILKAGGVVTVSFNRIRVALVLISVISSNCYLPLPEYMKKV